MVKAEGRDRPGEPCHTLAEVLKVLNGPIRCEILFLLAKGERDVSAMSQGLDLDVATVSHNLSMLRRRGLVELRQEHKRHVYALASCVRSAVKAKQIEVTVTAKDGDSVTLRK